MSPARRPNSSSRIESIHAGFARGDFDEVRRLLHSLDEPELAILRAQLGDDLVAELYRTARRKRRAKVGRVVVVNGIMGALLDSEIDADRDRVWVNAWRLATGRFGDFELTPAERPRNSDVEIRVAGLHKTYYKLMLELDSSWHVLPFPFDWRLDMDESARQLSAEISRWAGGEPVHLIAHSMGGLVCRRFIHLFPNQWEAMNDPGNSRRGGRLIMLGTPNRGSFAISLMLTGKEKKVKYLAAADMKHSFKEVLRIIGSFPGGYQMMPSPDVDLQDDHLKLYQQATWGGAHVKKALLDKGRRFQREMANVLTPSRLIYVAGYDQKTPCRVRIESPGKFEYQETRDGDGRVPHKLGLLEGVRTLWVHEAHGALPKNKHVLRGIHELLETGETTTLRPTKPTRRGVPEPEKWLVPEALGDGEDHSKEVEQLARGVRKRSRSRAGLTEGEVRNESRLEDHLLGPDLGDGVRETEDSSSPRGPRSGGDPPKLRVEVVWGDITRAAGDVYCVGHYLGVLPQNAEFVLDRVVSGERRHPVPIDALENMVLRSLTRRGVLRGDLGDIQFYPWAGSSRRIVAVAGMGQPGTFRRSQLRTLARSLAWAIGSLPGARTVSTVLIGSGAGALSTEVSVEQMLLGLADALQTGLGSAVRTLRFVEIDLGRALLAHEALQGVATRLGGSVDVSVPRKIKEGRGGWVGTHHGWGLALAAMAAAKDNRNAKTRRAAVRTILGELGGSPKQKKAQRDGVDRALGQLVKRAKSDDAFEIAKKVRVYEHDPNANRDAPARISFVRDDDVILSAAIHGAAVVPEREIGLDREFVRSIVDQTTDPAIDDLHSLSHMLRRMLLHEDLAGSIDSNENLVFEVDRSMAAVHWELMAKDADRGVNPSAPNPIGLRCVVARQLRTGYSPPITEATRFGQQRRAMIIGDPGDPERGDSLPGAREEALRVSELLTARGYSVDLLMGPSGADVRGAILATRLEVIRRLEDSYDLLHYAGHGDFDEQHPERVGWVFHDGLLTAGQLARVSSVPQLVVANACLSARSSNAYRGRRSRGVRDAQALLPSLADQFFKEGVRNYIGTAWEVSDEGAITFAESLYGELIPEKPGDSGVHLGEAVRRARMKLASDSVNGALWLAYQHYGDPLLRIGESGRRRRR